MLTNTSNREVQNEYINRRFLEFLKPQLQFFKFAQEGDVPQSMGDFIRWLDFPKMDVDVTSLDPTNSNDNEISSYSAVAVSGQILPYGRFLKIAENQAKTAAAGTLDAISMRLSELGARTVDTLLMNAALTTTKYFKQGQTASATGFITATDTLKAVTLAYINAEFQNGGVTGFESEGGQYAAILAPAQITHLQVEPSTTSGNITWSEVNKLSSVRLISPHAGS